MHEGRPGIRTSALLVVGGAVFVLGACGERVDARPASLGPVRVARMATERRLRVLDPGGRLWAHGERYQVFRRTVAGGLVELVGGLEEVAAGEGLLVVAPGCRIERVAAPASGELIVRLRVGIPVRVNVGWDGALPEGAELAGVSLRAQKPGREKWAEGLPPPRSLGSDVLDGDQPAPSELTQMFGPRPSVFLYVPEPGTYAVTCTVDGGNARANVGVGPDVEVAEDGPPLVVEREFPSAHLAQSMRLMRGKPR